MEDNQFFAQTSSADGVMIIDINGRSETEIINIAYQSVKSGSQIVMRNVAKIERSILERAAIVGQGLVLFDLR
ncbi:hypothetical protein [Salinimicrobium sp. TH3]|uniref:hypothetical protein n=1 Tax=Salinimicrobium sp. TH3 TaxID=2997342 RepID=UPI00227339CD|nr:hypothetical protein [Salinimicrobium sp. TH3]MCY2685935.1 hypothetical protein [Salinimicrobium sp. TH3]